MALRAAVLTVVVAVPVATGLPSGAQAAPTDLGSGTVLLQPAGDVLVKNAVGVANGSALKRGPLYPLVDDGTTFAAADDGASLVRSKLRATSAAHETSYSGAPQGVVTDAVVNLRVSRSPLARGSVQVVLYDGATQIATGSPHAVTGDWSNVSDEFSALHVADANNLRTTVRLTNSSGKGEIYYTELWTAVTYAAVSSPPAPPPPPPAADSPPTVTISSPANGATVTGPIVVSGTAADDLAVSELTISLDGGAPSPLSPAAGGAWAYPWDGTGAAGSHVFTVTATDSAGQVATAQVTVTAQDPSSSAPPSPDGYFSLQPVGSWSSLPSGAACTSMVHRSTWEPRPDNVKRNHTLVDPAEVHAAFAARPLAVDNNYDARWDSWLLPRVDGQFQGTTDEIFQWAACKWGLSDNVLRAIAVRESTWYQYDTYASGRCVTHWSCGDLISSADASTVTYCDALARLGGYDYQRDYGTGLCPKTFGIVGVMDWQAPSWGQMPDNQNGTFPFNRDSTAFAVDYLGSQLRGCYEGWEHWLGTSYAAGDMWGCAGAWYAGNWHSLDADGYVSRVQDELTNRTWLQPDWPSIDPACSPTYGCPGPDPL